MFCHIGWRPGDLMADMTTFLENTPALDDRRLVERHLAGDETAFREIVERHQAAVCAVAFSTCGDAEVSRDVAQEVFVAGWRGLPELREPEKLRPWLCGIARHRAQDAMRRDGRTPTAHATQITVETAAEGGGPREHASRGEESALLWRTLEGLPKIYREPLVMFYREHRSTQSVATALEISEDVVRQRLTRGRMMLGERMAGIVEETLERGGPGAAFTRGVLAALPVGATAAKGGAMTKAALTAGGVGAAAAKGGVALKALALVGVLPALLSGLGDFLRFRASYEAPGSSARRRRIVARYLVPNLLLAVLVLEMSVLGVLRRPGFPLARVSVLVLFLAVLGLFLVAYVGLTRWRKRAEAEEARMDSLGAGTTPERGDQAFEYRSARTLFGLPLVHINVRGSTSEKRRTARGWIAISDGISWGGGFAYSSHLAVAPLSLGPAAVGVLSLGIVGVGRWVAGGIAAGGASFGILAIGWNAAEGAILGWSGNLAKGFYAFGAHANDAVATAFFQQHLFFRAARATAELFNVTFLFLWLPPVVLVGWQLWRTRRAR